MGNLRCILDHVLPEPLPDAQHEADTARIVELEAKIAARDAALLGVITYLKMPSEPLKRELQARIEAILKEKTNAE